MAANLKTRYTVPAAMLLVLVAHGPGPRQARASELVTVQLQSGRHFSGQIDRRSDEDRLWLRNSSATATLLRPIAWDRVVAAQIGDERIAGDELRSRMASLSSTSAVLQVVAAEPLETIARGVEIPASRRSLVLPGVPLSHRARGPCERIQGVDFDVYLGNWDADVEVDGLVVHVFPFSPAGGPIATRATVDVELIAIRQVPFSDVPHGRGKAFRRVGHWTRAVHPADFGPAGAVLHLPFQSSHPEFDRDLANSGLVHLRLTAGGQGVFEHSQDGVRIRPWSPLRDSLERNQGHWFLPTERTGRGKTSR